MNEVEALLAANPLDCGSCRACCQHKPGILIVEEVGDDLALYDGFLDKIGDLQFLKTKPNGDCIFLNRETGCTAYDIRPTACRWYDCRDDYLKWVSKSRQERRELQKQSVLNKQVQQEGRKRLRKIFKG